MTTSRRPSNRFIGPAKRASCCVALACLGVTCRPAMLPDLPWHTGGRSAAPTATPAAAAGAVLERSFEDASYPFGLTIAEGWIARPGACDGALRLVLQHVPTQATLEVWVFHAATSAPRPRGGCDWSFRDRGSYEALRAPEAREIATCTPRDPEAPMVLAWSMVRDALAYHFELLVPPGRLVQARRAADALLDGVRFY